MASEEAGPSDDSDPATQRTRTKKRGGVFVTDAELIERLGVPEKIGYVTLHGLDQNRANGFPIKQKLWGGRRYWPAVAAWLDAAYLPRTPTASRR